jgi:hypothetical protein
VANDRRDDYCVQVVEENLRIGIHDHGSRNSVQQSYGSQSKFGIRGLARTTKHNNVNEAFMLLYHR